MRQSQIFRGGASALAIFAATTPALADVTADDVWANLGAYITAFGGTLTADVQRSGDILTLNDVKASFVLPMKSGAFDLTLDGLALIENGDGTVDIRYTDSPTISFGGTIPNEADGRGRVVLKPGVYTVVASGVPGAVTYDSQFSDLSFEVDDLTSSQVAIDLNSFEMSGAFDGWTSSTTVTQGALFSVTGHTEMQPYAYAISFADETVSSIQNGSGGKTVSDYSFAVPSAGTDLTQLAAAFAQGMFFEFSNQSDGTTSNAETRMEGQVFSNQRTSQGPMQAQFRIDQTALTMSATATQAEVSTLIEFSPMVISFDIAAIEVDLSFPLSASEDPQPFRVLIDAKDLRMGADIWAQFDSGKQLPRDPFNLRFDTSGKVSLDVDLMDWTALSEVVSKGAMPVRLDQIIVGPSVLAGLGVLATAEGGFEIDNTDLTSFGGFPKPVGTGTMTATGVNGLLDQLIAIGAITQDEASGARLGMTMFTDATGDDTVTSTLQVDENGAVSVNGQRIR